MKKSKLILMIIILSLVLTGCGKKIPITKEEFSKSMKEEDYTISDAITQLEPIAKDKIKSITLAISKDKKHQIEFYELMDEEIAKTMFETNKKIFDNLSPNKKQEENTNGNFRYYKQKSNGRIYLISNIEKTLLYAIVNEEEEEKLDKMVKKLGY